ncbi:MAG: hypothetical protein ACOX69_10500 [Coriobacteriales bacterium]|jgi:hypothetical protein
MNFLIAFLVAGVVGFVGEIVYLLCKKNMLLAVVVMFAIGAILAFTPFPSTVGAAAPGCLAGLLMNGGTMYCQSVLDILNVGDPALFIVIWVIVFVMALLGIVAGIVANRKHKEGNEREE